MSEQPKHVFRPKARLMVLLGEQLIKNHTLALFELVKNAYDADASKVDITLLDVDELGGMIEIEDDGLGMSYETVTNIWLEPAHDHKAKARIAGERSAKGRLPVGEKGVGRFAVHRLGNIISMVTRASGHEEVVVDIDWESFLKNEYLDESEIKINTRKPEVFKGKRTGTRIIVSSLRQQWRRGDVRKLYRSVSSMTPPALKAEDDKPSDKFDQIVKPKSEKFDVNFTIDPDKKWLAGLFDPLLAVSQSLFRFDFSLTEEGLSYRYSFTPLEGMKADYPELIVDRDVEIENIKSLDFFKYKPPEVEGGSKNKHKRDQLPSFGDGEDGLGIGPIRGRIIGFDFDKEIYARYQKDESGGLVDYVREQGGIRVYRDGLRVYSYGEPGDDWLHLDHRRIQGPTKKFGSRQMIGALHLNLENSSGLIEKTNREGFVENKAYTELVHSVLSVLTQFEAERNKDKRILKDILALAPGRNDKSEVKRKSTVEELFDGLQKEVSSKEAYLPLKSIVSEVSKAYQETRNVLMSAAGAGMGLVTVFHEMERGVRSLNHAIKDGTEISALKAMSEELVSLLRGAMYMVNTKEMEILNASKLVEYVLLTQRRRLKRHGITFINGFESGGVDFEVKGIRRMLTTTLVNLLDNSIYWADDGEDKEKYIWIGSSHNLEGPAIVIADSGAGFIDSAEDVIQPFFTRKPSGMGIGLYYSDMVMKTIGGRLAFPEFGAVERPEVVSGSCVAMVFKKEGVR
jgi:signal transduction histidine kinase